MKPDKFDIKIKEAAAKYEQEKINPEQAWGDMEKLLNKEMPQKKDRKLFLWILLPLILGSGIYVMYSKTWKNKGEIIVSKNENPGQQSITKNNIVNNTAKLYNTNKDSIARNNNFSTTNNIAKTNSAQPATPMVSRNRSLKEIIFQKSEKKSVEKFQEPLNREMNKQSNSVPENNSLIYQNKNLRPVEDVASKNDIEKQNSFSFLKKEEPVLNKQEPTANSMQVNNSVQSVDAKHRKDTELLKKDSIQKIASDETAIKDSSVKKTEMKNPVQAKNKFANSFAFNFSAGPDISTVNVQQFGNVTIVYGAGLSYQVTKRFTLRTGFYVSKKVYDANAGNYHPPAGFWSYYPDLKYISANCKVYEVPLILSYNFSNSVSHSWFASAGISSYFMKKEVYDYYSKIPGEDYGSYSLSNKNKHYFDVLRFSTGYEKKFNNKISLDIEPYFNIPMQGVGYGKVKLYGAGVLFTLGIKPFAKK